VVLVKYYDQRSNVRPEILVSINDRRRLVDTTETREERKNVFDVTHHSSSYFSGGSRGRCSHSKSVSTERGYRRTIAVRGSRAVDVVLGAGNDETRFVLTLLETIGFTR
jgi:hypothetical protein